MSEIVVYQREVICPVCVYRRSRTVKCLAEWAHEFKSWFGIIDVIEWRCPECKLGYTHSADPSMERWLQILSTH